jgi:preprotein translocase subunit SecA
MMTSIAQDFVKYVMHVQVVTEDAKPADGRTCRPPAPRTPVERWRHGRGGPGAGCGRGGSGGRGARSPSRGAVNMQPVVKSDWDKTPRNAPCPCGSGKKFKHCHGAA